MHDPYVSLNYTSMYRTIEMLCLILLDRSRVISGHSRDIGYLVIFEYMEYWNRLEKEKKMETGRGKASPVCVG